MVVTFFDTTQKYSTIYMTNLIILQARSYGISSLSHDLNGVNITASCMDSRYSFNVLIPLLFAISTGFISFDKKNIYCVIT